MTTDSDNIVMGLIGAGGNTQLQTYSRAPRLNQVSR